MNLIEFKNEYQELISKIPDDKKSKLSKELEESKRIINSINQLPLDKASKELPKKKEDKIRKLLDAIRDNLKH